MDYFLTKKMTQGKTIFWDLDGTIAPYRYNGHLSASDGTDNGMTIDDIYNHVFEKRPPSRFMQKVMSETGAKENILIGHYRIDMEIEQKDIWLDAYFPEIKKRLFLNHHMSKANQIIEYCEKNNIKIEDVLYVDDVISFLQDAERKGISAWHISSFMDWFEE